MKTKVLYSAAVVALAAVRCRVAASARDLMVVGFGGGFQDNARKHLFQGYAKANGIKVVKDDVYNGEMAKVYSMVKSQATSPTTWSWSRRRSSCAAARTASSRRSTGRSSRRTSSFPAARRPAARARCCWGVTLFYDARELQNGPDNYAEALGREEVPGQAPAALRRRRRRSRSRCSPTACRRRRLQGARHPRGPEARVRQARPDQAATSCGGSRARSRCSSSAAARSPTRSASPGAPSAPTRAARSIRCCGRRCSTRSTTGRWCKGSPNAKEGMKMIEWMTDAKPLLALAEDWAVSPANTEAAANPELVRKNPGMLASHANDGLFINTEFWVEHGEDLERSSTPGSRSKSQPDRRASGRVDEEQPACGGADRAAADPRRRELPRAARGHALHRRSAIRRYATRCRARPRRCRPGMARACRPKRRSRSIAAELRAGAGRPDDRPALAPPQLRAGRAARAAAQDGAREGQPLARPIATR